MLRTVWTRKTWRFRSLLDPWAVPGEISPEDPGSNFFISLHIAWIFESSFLFFLIPLYHQPHWPHCSVFTSVHFTYTMQIQPYHLSVWWWPGRWGNVSFMCLFDVLIQMRPQPTDACGMTSLSPGLGSLLLHGGGGEEKQKCILPPPCSYFKSYQRKHRNKAPPTIFLTS